MAENEGLSEESMRVWPPYALLLIFLVTFTLAAWYWANLGLGSAPRSHLVIFLIGETVFTVASYLSAKYNFGDSNAT